MLNHEAIDEVIHTLANNEIKNPNLQQKVQIQINVKNNSKPCEAVIPVCSFVSFSNSVHAMLWPKCAKL